MPQPASDEPITRALFSGSGAAAFLFAADLDNFGRQHRKIGMRSLRIALGAGLMLASPALAEEPADTSGSSGEAPTCQVAEVNPVTGHVFCIRPLGAPVEAPTRDDIDCKEETREAADWTWGPKCKG